MGLGTSKKKFLTNEEIDRISSNNKSLDKFYMHHKGYEGYITQREFRYIFSKVGGGGKITKILFKIFSSEKDKIFYEDLKYLYAMFYSRNFPAKLNFITELIFSKNSSKSLIKFIDRVNILFSKHEVLKMKLTSKDFLSRVCEKNNLNKIIKENFAKNLATYNENFFNNFEFIKINKNKFGEQNECECFISNNLKNGNKNLNLNNSSHDLNEFIYDKMETEFRRMEKNNDGLFSIIMLDKILIEIGVHPKLISLISVYLKRQTQRNFLDFKYFKSFLLSFIGDNNEKIKILYEILSYPKNYIEKKIILGLIDSFLLSSNKEEFFIKLKDNLPEKIELILFNSIFLEFPSLYEIINSLDRVNYISYLFFKIRPDEKRVQKTCIEILTKGEKDLKKHIEDILINENDFYCVNYEFWESWCNFVEWDRDNNGNKNEKHKNYSLNEEKEKEIKFETYKKPRINNEKIIGEYIGKLKTGLEYFKDFIILPYKIYDLFSKWYLCSGGEIKLKKISYKVNEIKINSKILNSANTKREPIPSITKNNIIYEIELYPIFMKYFSFEEIIKNINEISIDAAKNLIKSLSESNLNQTRVCSFTRKTLLRDIKTTIEKNYKLSNVMTNLWMYNKGELFKVEDLNRSLEEGGETILDDFCLVILETMNKDKEWLSQVLTNKKKKNEVKENLIIDSKNEKNNENNNVTSNTQRQIKKALPTIDPALIGIHNIGNTCYMNAILQSLLNLKELQEIFMTKNFKYCINYKNKYGYKGKIIKEFLKLLEEKFINQNSSMIIKPVTFKEVIGEINPQFKNNLQQDAQEFINFLIDVLHEEINLKDEKEYIPNPEMFDYTEKELSGEYWANNMRRNASFIHSLFLGQLKSNLICAACETNKISYETFTNLSLPITQKKTIILEVVLFRVPFIFKAYYLDKLKLNNNNNDNDKEEEIDIRKSLSIIRKESFDVCNDTNDNEVTECENEIKIKIGDEYSENSNSKNNNNNLDQEKEKESKISSSDSNLLNNLYASRLSTSIPLKIILEIDRKSKVSKIIQLIKEMNEFELESENSNLSININNCINSSLPMSDYIIMAGNETIFIDVELKIDECFQNNQVVYVYELLTTNGINKILNTGKISNNNLNSGNEIKRKNSLLLYQSKKSNKNINVNNSNSQLNSLNSRTTIDSISTQKINDKAFNYTSNTPLIKKYPMEYTLPLNFEVLSKYNQPALIEKYLQNDHTLKIEYLIGIIHRYPIEVRDFYLIRKDSFGRLDVFFNVILVNNNKNFNARFLYEYIWEKYEYTLNNPAKGKNLVWWGANSEDSENIGNKEKTENSKNEKLQKKNNYFNSSYNFETNQNQNNNNTSQINSEIKYCSPFVIKLLNKDDNSCTKCPWFNFCTGCVLDPFNEEDVIISPNQVIVIEWCNNIVKNEMNEANLRLIINHESVKTKEDDLKTKTLDECINLFLEKEFLGEENANIYCSKCRSLQNFYKKYDLDQMPPILILSIKRFKFAKMYKKKIDNLIDFPIYDLDLKSSKYDLYGVINHTGVLSAGHYTAIVKINDKWIKCDDSSCYEVEEKSIVTPGAYILIYKLKDEINTNYYKMMGYVFNNLDIQVQNQVKNDLMQKVFVPGEPVKTLYGKGYVVEEIFRDGIKSIKVKFRYGYGVLNENSVKKEISLQVSLNSIVIEEEKLKILKAKNENYLLEQRKREEDNISNPDSMCLLY